ncbi:MAG: HDOD domain-containing protein [Fimbriimonadaceae bacterium]|nr:HDOD domain-containing protein [Fimbriimonadaceae bacterium]
MALQSEPFLLRRYIEKAMVDLPAMPTVLVEVVRLVDRESVTTAEIEQVLSKDAALTTKVLKVVNSAYFGLPRRVTGISHAIAILGFQQVKNLAMSLAVLNALSSSNARIRQIQTQFWETSFAAGFVAETIARRKGMSTGEIETCYVGALLHDIGKLFLLTLFNAPYQQIMKESVDRHLPVHLIEQKVLGLTHGELGGELAERWNFPTDLVGLIRSHHGHFSDRNAGLEYIVHAADVVGDSVSGDELVGLHTPIAAEAADWIGYRAEDYEELKILALASVEKARQFLGIL